jgi:hypothetical protein
MQDRERKAAKQKGQHCYSALIGCRQLCGYRDMKGGTHKFDVGKYDTPSPFAMPSIILRDYLKPEGSSVVEFLAGDMCFTADEREYWSTEG